jgi:hypothetical protein
MFGNPRKSGDPGMPDRAAAVQLHVADFEAGVLIGYKRPWILMAEELIQAELRGWHPACRSASNRSCSSH